jgi:hypothetical protein
MRFLKKKLQQTFKAEVIVPEDDDNITAQPGSPPSVLGMGSFDPRQPFKIMRPAKVQQQLVQLKKTPPTLKTVRHKKADGTLSKNIVKNYGKAMAAFAASKLAQPYLEDLAKEHRVRPIDFHNFIASYKESIDSIDSLRGFLLPYEDDEEEIQCYKRIFQGLCEVFLKYFAVNWVTHGRMMHKDDHLKYRNKMLRRVRNPEIFTYLTTRLHK